MKSTDAYDNQGAIRMTDEDIKALRHFIETYPTWWWKIGHCEVSRDFDCAPQLDSPEINRSQEVGDVWDTGFSCDHKGSIADAIYQVMDDIEMELRK